MSATNSNYLTVANGHIDSLISYVLDVKPYHTKLSAIVERYLFEDTVNVKVNLDNQILAFMGADIMPSIPTTLGVRQRRTTTWFRDVISDGQRTVWNAPLTSVHKFASHAGRQHFTAGIDDDTQIPGIGLGVFSQQRLSGPSITDVRKNNIHQQESFDYFLSHGVYSFDTFSNGRWKELNVSQLSAYAENAGDLIYIEAKTSFATIINIVGGNYEEWTLTCVDANAGSLSVTGSESGYIGLALFGQIFSNPLLSFTYAPAVGETLTTASLHDTLVLTPFNKITVAPTTLAESWSLIKTNPIVVTGKPTFAPSPSAPIRTAIPSLEIHTRSLDRLEAATTWYIEFNGDNTYNLTKTIIGVGTYVIGANIDLKDGCSFKNADIHFTLIPTADGFYAGDVFDFTLGTPEGVHVENFLVYGSISGWQKNAKIGEWYWNGKIGFKIPKLEYVPRVFNSTIITSATGNANSWNTTVSNNQILKSISFDNGVFYTAGEQQIAGASINGLSWTSDIASLLIPAPSHILTVVGDNGTIATSIDGVTFTHQASHTTNDLKATTFIPNFLTGLPNDPVLLNCIIVVGLGGTVLTSINGIGWAKQPTGSDEDLYDITWSPSAIIAIGRHGTILRSLDRQTWTQVASNTTADLKAIIYEPITNAFLVVGLDGTILRSTDGGLTWFNLGAFSTGAFSDIAYGQGKFIIVSTDGWTATSTDGIAWTRYASKSLNSIAFGNGSFVGVGGSTRDVEQFVALKTVHSIAEPSVYTITFTSPTTASVVNNIYGYRAGLIPNVNWEDEFVAFRLDAIPNVYEYQTGDVIKVYLAPMTSIILDTAYDVQSYDDFKYDTSIADARVPLIFNQEVFPLYHSHGSVIFKSVISGDKFIIDKAYKDVVRFKLLGASDTFPELGAVDDWLPLEFRYLDRPASSRADYDGRTAHFPDLTTRIEAYSATNPSLLVFTIEQPRFEKTDKNASATITLATSFFAQYIKFNTRFSFLYLPDGPFSQNLRVKITENLRAYARIREFLFDGPAFSDDNRTVRSRLPATDSNNEFGFGPYEPPILKGSYQYIFDQAVYDADVNKSNPVSWYVLKLVTVAHPYPFKIVTTDKIEWWHLAVDSKITFVDLVNAHFTEGGALPVDGGYDIFPFDTVSYDMAFTNGILPGFIELTPGEYDFTGNATDWLIPKKTVEPSTKATDASIDVAGTRFAESLFIVERTVGSPLVINRLSASYDVNLYPATSNGLLISNFATEYLINHNGPASTPNLVVESLDNLGTFGNPVPNLFPFTQMPTTISLKAFTFTLPAGFTAPFRLRMV